MRTPVLVGAAALAAAALWFGSTQLGGGGDPVTAPGVPETSGDARPADPDRDAAIEASRAAINADDPERAAEILVPLVEANPEDAAAQYNLGVASHKSGKYNAARSGYLRALRANPEFPDARYNLVVLTWNRGVQEEARHHLRKFKEAWPNEPRIAELEALVGAAP